jgi:hypothetical protein
MNTLLDAISDGWGWKLGRPVATHGTNAFGNAIVEDADGRFWRIIPEELDCTRIANSPRELEEVKSQPEFSEDWMMQKLVERAQASQGPLPPGRVYCLVIPGVLGGAYSESNIRTITLAELLSCSGYMARQIDGLPDGTNVELKVTE